MKLPRVSGILLHPTSLPGPHGSGDLGAAACHFVDWLASAGQKLWQILPLGGIGPGNSPYMSSSAFAGNVLLIDLAELQSRGWLGFSAATIHLAAAIVTVLANLGVTDDLWLDIVSSHHDDAVDKSEFRLVPVATRLTRILKT